MKKIIAAMLVSCMVLSPAVVMAEESTESTDSTEMTEVNWEEDIVTPGAFEDVIKDGRFVTFDEIAVQMWVPNVLRQLCMWMSRVKILKLTRLISKAWMMCRISPIW